MATRKIVPRANGEGAIGDNTAGAEKYWGGGFFNTINGANAIEMAAFNDGLQWKASTAYAKGSIVFTSGLSAGMYLECLVDGTSNTDKFAIPSSIVPNTTTITDNTVTWIVREICSTQIDDSYSRKPNTTYLRGEIRFLYEELPVGWFLECSVAGVSGSGDLTITTPAEGSTVTDGTVTWVMKKMGTGSGGGDGVPLGAILPLAHNSTIPAGYLLCDGSAVSRTMFPDLFAAIGTTYGAGDGSTTFNVPDYNAAKRFAQGDAVAGTVKNAGLPNIEGKLDWSAITANIPQAIIDGTVASGALGVDNKKSFANGAAVNPGVGYNTITLDASLSNPIYGASNTVQPNALTARYIIKAFDGQTADSALIDITQYANELAGKANRALDNLTQAGEDSFLERDFTIIYPNGGSEASPANVTTNSRYVESNPFPGYYVTAIPEIFFNNDWLPITSFYSIGTGSQSYGMGCQTSSTLVGISTGASSITGGNAQSFNVPSENITSAPCRVKVWKIGKIPTT
jgi:microcystin-dependent protein